MTQEFKQLIEIALNKVFLKDYSGAIDDYNKAIELYPNYAIAYYNRGGAKYDLKDYAGAIADYNKAIELDSKCKHFYYFRAKVRKELGDIKGHDIDMKKYDKLQREYIFKN